ncbi:toll/interleukin-1 receptor domain-containing protein [Actinoplanes awajinensis]|uniref:toll/interleukin-1 receptor domain-containing protein n=1 Tax=Actinoplanes awajinensis TaxID=135946 RepID=UPI000AD9B842|nr:TIR domain-containing protein [Actinoplanes awajinensis]
MTVAAAQTFDYDVALSYAGEDRAYVQQVAELLKQRDIRIFYDEYAAAELWGSDLYVLLDEVYRKRARFAVAFVSAHYVSKTWTRHERQSVQARALIEIGPYLLPVRLDDSELPGLRPTVAYVDARRKLPEQLVSLIEQKLSVTPGVTTIEPPVLRVPRTTDQQRELLAQRPPAWEYLLYAGVLWQRREALEPKWRDHELGYARRTGQHFDDREVFDFLGNVFNDLQAFGPNILKMLATQAQERAFGPLGQSGDPALIEHIATRFVEVYEDLIDMAANLRGAGVSRKLAPYMETAAHLTDTPLREIREFIDQIVAVADSLPERLATGDPIVIELMFTLTVDDEALKNHEREGERVKTRLLE